MTGTPLLGFKRMQFNMFLKKESKISVMNSLSDEEKLVPLFWVEEVNKLNVFEIFKTIKIIVIIIIFN